MTDATYEGLLGLKIEMDDSPPAGRPHRTCYPTCSECRTYFRSDAYRTYRKIYESVCKRLWRLRP